MEILPRETVEISVVLYQEDSLWIAQGIEFDITARGATPLEASERFNSKVGAELVMSLELGDNTPLSSVGAAPQKFWQMYRNARMRVVDAEDTPLRVIDGGGASRVRPHIRISDEKRAA